MYHDTIVEEVRRVREAHAARFGYDLKRIFADIKEKELASGRKLVRFTPARGSVIKTAKAGKRKPKPRS